MYTERDVNQAVEAVFSNLEKGETMMQETEKERSERENRNYCKRIAEDIENAASGDYYKCPNCGEIHTMADYQEKEHEDEDGYTGLVCPWCDKDVPEDDLESFWIGDYFNDALDIEYRVGSDGKYRSIKIMVTCGGPNIYVDTSDRAVKLYWWCDRAEFPLSNYACDAIDEYFEELYSCR